MKIEELHHIYKNCKSVCTDTRKLQKGDIYFALKGDNFDGNKFAKDALGNGANYCVIDDVSLKTLSEKFILVDDVLVILQQLANYHRKQVSYPIIALTGSNGKTTTKELIYNVLSSNYKVKATKGNLNNHIGVPLTLLSFTEDLDFGIVEMGANHLEEIEFLCTIAEPDFGLITNFGKAHLEGFGGIDGVIKGKSELYNYLRENNKIAFINTDDEKQIEQIGSYTKRSCFGSSKESDCVISFESANTFVHVSYDNAIIESKLIGNYNYSNIAVAIAIGEYFEVPSPKIKNAIEAYQPDNNRSEITNIKTNKIILDAYNANPTSMLAALNYFKQLEADKKYIFLGDMFELGAYAKVEHQAIVDFAEANFKKNIYLVGENFYNTKTNPSTYTYLSFEDLEKTLKEASINNSTLLIKGSRGMALERVLDIL